MTDESVILLSSNIIRQAISDLTIVKNKRYKIHFPRKCAYCNNICKPKLIFYAIKFFESDDFLVWCNLLGLDHQTLVTKIAGKLIKGKAYLHKVINKEELCPKARLHLQGVLGNK